MLRSSGYFSDVSCPLSASCKRPQCLFKHAAEETHQPAEIQLPLIDSTGDDDPLEFVHNEDHLQPMELEHGPQFWNHTTYMENGHSAPSFLTDFLLPEEKSDCTCAEDERMDDAAPGPSRCPPESVVKGKRGMCVMQCSAVCQQGPCNDNVIDLTECLDDLPCMRESRHTQTDLDSPPQPDSSTMAIEGPIELSDDEIIEILSDSEDDEPNNLDVNLTENEPMEECYKIFMDELERNDVDAAEENAGLINQKQSPEKPVEANETEPTEQMPVCQREPSSSAKTAANLQPAPVPDGCTEYVAETLINMGNNLYLLLMAAGNSSAAAPALTPICGEHVCPGAVKQPLCPRVRRSTILIPAQACKRSKTSSRSTSTASAPAPQTAVPPPVKPGGRKRKSKQQPEAPKVPYDIRQKYVNDFTAEFYKTTANGDSAFNKALALERSVYNCSVNVLKYRSVAVNALKSLRKKRAAATAKATDDGNDQILKGNVPLTLQKCKGDMALYKAMKEYIVSEEMLSVNYPAQHPEKHGSAVLSVYSKKSSDPCKRICCRCGATYLVSKMGKHVRQEECYYHYGKTVQSGVARGNEMRYTCCEGVLGTPGCEMCKFHVHDSFSLDGFVSTAPRPASAMSCPGVYSLNCEMCYTIHGRELSRVTLVNSSLQVIYDTFVRPANEVIDYDTRFTGIREEDVKGSSLREVQETLLSFISDDTILIGHSLETDFCALKLFHRTVVDTSVVFPHPLGPPHKMSLNSLTAEHLRKIIQENINGHDTAEDATATMELMLLRIKKDAKLKE